MAERSREGFSTSVWRVPGRVKDKRAMPVAWRPSLTRPATRDPVGMSGHYCLIRALDATEAVRIQPLVYLQMVYAQGIGLVVFDEALDPLTLLGMAMIVGAGLYAIWREAALARQDPTGS